MWERWNSLLADGTISGISMNSMNHYAYGSIQEWMFRHVAGINTTEEHPGACAVQFIPTLNWELRYADATYDSASGTYHLRRELPDKEHVTIMMDVPFGCKAEVWLPLLDEKEKKAIAEVLGTEENGSYMLAPGHYEVSYTLSERLGKNYTLDIPLRVLMNDPAAKEILAKELQMPDVPEQYRDYSIRELSEKFGTEMTKEQETALADALEKLAE